jgi:broad specificity phosphatase PhoE
MKVYFVRHGESEFNVQNLHQHPEVALTEHGERQAEFIAKRLERIKINYMFASPYLRTKQTAEIIAKRIKKKIEYSDLIVELVRPTELIGLSFTDPKSVAVKDAIKRHVSDPSWHHSDEENFFDFRTRALKFVELLEKRFTNEHVLVVTHGHIMRMIMAVMFQPDISPDVFHRYETFFMTRNTGITIVEKKMGKDWRLLTWNDHAHLR